MMLLLLAEPEGPEEIDNSNIIELEARRTLKVQRVEEDELEVVEDVPEEVARAKRTVEKVEKVKTAFGEQVAEWAKKHAAK